MPRYDGPVRFPVVLFDLDGTVIDTGAIILASMRHATREVLGRDFADEELMAAVGSRDGREIVLALDALRQNGLERDGEGRYFIKRQ